MQKQLINISFLAKLCLWVVFCLITSSIYAATVNMSMQNYFTTYDEAPLSCSNGGVTLTAAKANATTAPAYNTNKGLCIYADGTLTIDAGTDHITAISFVINTNGMKQLADLTCSTGTLTQKSQTAPTWSGNASTVVFTVGSKATYGSSTSKAGQLCFTDITITTDGDGTNGENTSLLPEYPFTAGQVLYYGTTYSATPNFQLWLYSDDIDLDLANSSAQGTNGSIARFDLFRSSTTNICGSYTIAEDGVYDKDGGISKTYSYWTTYIDEGFVEYRLVKGNVSIECVTRNTYNITYDVTEINNGMHHAGSATNIPITAVTESGTAYTLTNNCPDTEVEAITTAQPFVKKLIDGHLYISTSIGTFDAQGRQISK